MDFIEHFALNARTLTGVEQKSQILVEIPIV